MAETVVGAFEKLFQQITELMDLPAEATLDEVAELVGISQRCLNACEELHRRVAEAVRRSDAWALDGFRSPAPWIAFHSGLTRPAAGKLHRHATAMAAMPRAAAAAADGTLNSLHVEQLARCQRRAPERYSEQIDASFTALATAGNLDSFASAVRAWHEHLDAEEGPDRETTPQQRSSFSLPETLDGWCHGTLALTPEDAAIVRAALDVRINAMLRRKHDGDPTLEDLNITALRAQALVDLSDADLRRNPTQRRLPDRHRVTLILRLDEHGNVTPVGPVPPAATCDSDVTRMVLSADGEILDVGRTQRSWPTPIANAVIHRDRTCVFPACGAPPGHCDVHHCVPWENGGETAVTNGALLCRWHHTFLHRHRWTIRLDEHQKPIIRRPDGTPHTLRTHQPQRE
jgi:hypothetical protein